MSLEIRVGQGFDVHRAGDDPDRPMVLGGCRFPGVPALVGHSDGDAVAHAVTEALLGAAGLGDIGQHFPDDDDAWKGADSMRLLSDVCTFLEMCLDAGRPVALSSDAHRPEQLGYEYERAVEWLGDMGVTELSVFERRARRLEPIGAS